MTQKSKITHCPTASVEDLSPIPEELAGVDYKYTLASRWRRHRRHNRVHLNTTERQTRFLHNVTAELSRRENHIRMQRTFKSPHQPDRTVVPWASKRIWCSNEEITVYLSSPIHDVCLYGRWIGNWYIQKWKNSELIQECFQRNGEEDGDLGEVPATFAKPLVIAVNTPWRKAIEITQHHKLFTRTRQLSPIMRKTDFNFETKNKFSKLVESTCEDLFPDWRNLMILHANDTEGVVNNGTVKAAMMPPYLASDSVDPHISSWQEFNDMEEHHILVVPSYTKKGFDMDLSKHYRFPYSAEFVIGARTYHHEFVLRVPLNVSPQHYGLIFTFSENPEGQRMLIIKSLLTVYSIFPETPKHACLKTYEDDVSSRENQFFPGALSKVKFNHTRRSAENAVQLIFDNLSEAKATRNIYCTSKYELTRGLPQPGKINCRSRRRLYDLEVTADQKQKRKKHQLQREIEMDMALCC